MIGKLVVEVGVKPGKVFVVQEGRTLHIGRDRANEYSAPNNTNLSRVHCKIENRAGSLVVTDMDSKNGTSVNGVPVKSRVLRDNDVIEAGRLRMRVVIESRQPVNKSEAASEPIIAIRRPMRTQPVGPHEPNVAPDEPYAFPPHALGLIGKMVGGYQIVGAIAAGHTGVVYKGLDPATNRAVAVKILSDELVADSDAVHRFLTGANRAAGLAHECLVPVISGGRIGDSYYVVGMYMPGGSALMRFRHVPTEGVESVKLALQVAIHVTRALEYGLGEKVTHRGVRPTKVLFDENQHPRLNGLGFDNGLGLGFSAKSPMAVYLAPDQVHLPSVALAKEGDPASADSLADIYGMGATFHYMLTGQAPQRGPKGELRSPRLLNRAVPESLCRILEKMLEMNRDERCNSYSLLLHDLRWALRGEVWSAA